MSTQGDFQAVHAEHRLHAVADAPAQYTPGIPVDDRHQVDEPACQPDIRDVRTPDLIGPDDGHTAQQVRPVESHLEASDFAIKPIRLAVRRHRLRAALCAKHRLRLLLDFLPPLAFLDRENPVLLTDFINCLDPSQGVQPDLRLELRQVDFSLLRFAHDFPVSCDSVPPKLLSQIRGPL